MGLSLRDQLIQAGFAQPKPEPPPARPERGHGGKPGDRNAQGRPNDRNNGRRPDQRSGTPGDRNVRTGSGPDESVRTRSGPTKAGPTKAGPTKAGPDQAGPANARPSKAGPTRPAAAKAPNLPRDPNREPSLAAAYNARAETEKREREQAQKLAQEEVVRKREQRLKLSALVVGKQVNVPLSEHTRNFMYGKKIRKVNVTAEQFLQLNSGELGVVQVDGRFMILPAEIMVEVLSLGRQFIALFVPEGIGASDNPDDDYSDPRYKVPDDLVW